MPLDDFYINSIAQKKKGNMDIYEDTLFCLFKKVLSWSEVEDLEKNKQLKLMLELSRRIKIQESPYDIQKIARAIQNSRSGVGGCAMTDFECAFCGERETWGNTNTPNICKSCAETMAETIVLCGMKIEKDKKEK